MRSFLHQCVLIYLFKQGLTKKSHNKKKIKFFSCIYQKIFIQFILLYVSFITKFTNMHIFILMHKNILIQARFFRKMLICVCSAMSLQVTFIWKYFVTNFTNMMLFTCMCQKMWIQVVLSWTSFVANITNMRLFTCMR